MLGQAGIDKDVVEGAMAGMFDLGDVPDMPLVTHNRPFGKSCLKSAFEEFGMEYLGCNFIVHLSLHAGILIYPATDYIFRSQLVTIIWKTTAVFYSEALVWLIMNLL